MPVRGAVLPLAVADLSGAATTMAPVGGSLIEIAAALQS